MTATLGRLHGGMLAEESESPDDERPAFDEESEREWQELLSWAGVREPQRAPPGLHVVANHPADEDGNAVLAQAKAVAGPVAAPASAGAPAGLEDEEWQWQVARAKVSVG